MTDVRPETLRLQKERLASETDDSEDSRSDFLLDAIDRATPYLDAGWSPSSRKLKPSTVMVLRYCVLMSSGLDGAKAEAQRLAVGWLAEARRRYKQGFYANPFGQPVKRRIAA